MKSAKILINLRGPPRADTRDFRKIVHALFTNLP